MCARRWTSGAGRLGGWGLGSVLNRYSRWGICGAEAVPRWGGTWTDTVLAQRILYSPLGQVSFRASYIRLPRLYLYSHLLFTCTAPLLHLALPHEPIHHVVRADPSFCGVLHGACLYAILLAAASAGAGGAACRLPGLSVLPISLSDGDGGVLLTRGTAGRPSRLHPGPCPRLPPRGRRPRPPAPPRRPRPPLLRASPASRPRRRKRLVRAPPADAPRVRVSRPSPPAQRPRPRTGEHQTAGVEEVSGDAGETHTGTRTEKTLAVDGADSYEYCLSRKVRSDAGFRRKSHKRVEHWLGWQPPSQPKWRNPRARFVVSQDRRFGASVVECAPFVACHRKCLCCLLACYPVRTHCVPFANPARRKTAGMSGMCASCAARPRARCLFLRLMSSDACIRGLSVSGKPLQLLLCKQWNAVASYATDSRSEQFGGTVRRPDNMKPASTVAMQTVECRCKLRNAFA